MRDLSPTIDDTIDFDGVPDDDIASGVALEFHVSKLPLLILHGQKIHQKIHNSCDVKSVKIR